MLNIIRADLYRIFRGKGAYITVGILLFFAVLQVASGTAGTIGVNTSAYDLHPDLILTGLNSSFYIMRTTDNLLYFMLPFYMFVSAADFSTGAVKNVLSNGVSRSKFYASKLILSCFFCVVLALINVITAIIAGTVVNGFGGSFNGEFVISVLKPFSFQLYLLFAATCVGTFLVFATKKSAAVNGIYIAFCIVPAIIVLLISEFSDKFLDLIYFDMSMSLKMFSNYSEVTSGDIVRTLFIGGFYIIASTICGLVIFKKSEIK